jgi:hypothetical protein
MRIRLAAIVSLVVLAGVPMFGHHGGQAYEETPVVVKDATVTDFLWANPHIIIRFDSKDAQGKVLHWAGELGSPSALANRGWSRASVKKGDVITVQINQSKTGNPVGRIDYIQFPDGKVLTDSGGAGPGDAAGAARGGGGRGGRGGRSGAEYE